MTTVFKKTEKCSVCGEDSQQSVVGSASSFGSMDLDMRPSEMLRSAMRYWIKECPHCGYTANSLVKPIKCDKEYLKSPEYKDFPDPSPISTLARQFARKARISIKEADYVGASKAYMNAAWASDDERDETWQSEFRMLVMQMMERFNEKEMDDNQRVLRADLLRKTRQFERLIQEYENVSFENDFLNKIARFQILKAKDKDTATYTVKDIPS